jgi:photosystem II stability/assembly factor-like uncharacterized protein
MALFAVVCTVVIITLVLIVSRAAQSKQPSPAGGAPDRHAPAPATLGVLPPLPAIAQLPKLPPGMYTCGFIWGWDGSAWRQEAPIEANPITGICRVGSELIAVGWEEAWRRSGTQWVREGDKLPRLFDVWSSGQEAFAVGARGAVFRRMPGGEWLREASRTTATLLSITGRHGRELYAVGFEGTLIRSDGGGEWWREDTGTAETLHGVSCDNEQVIAVGAKGLVLRKVGDAAWTTETCGIDESLSSVWCAGGGVAYATGNRGTILKRDASGRWTTEAKVGKQLQSVCGLGPNQLLALGLLGSVYQSRGDGAWVDVSGSHSLSLAAALLEPSGATWITGDRFFEIA